MQSFENGRLTGREKPASPIAVALRHETIAQISLIGTSRHIPSAWRLPFWRKDILLAFQPHEFQTVLDSARDRTAHGD